MSRYHAAMLTLPDGATLTTARTEAQGKQRALFIYAPGAGANVHDPFGRYLAPRLAEHGIETVRIQFPYMEAKKRRPDPPTVLEATWRAAIDALRPRRGTLIAGGRSMGGRIASQVVAQGASVDALALFAYPLHPPGRPERMRDAHLPQIAVPTLFCSGTRDAFASPDELRAAAAKVSRATVHLLEHADHAFAAPKASGRTREDIWSEAAEAMIRWLAGIP
jgi:predicted alpha/beta-hydrolase family hydrolase